MSGSSVSLAFRELRDKLKTDNDWKTFRNIVRSSYDPEFDTWIDEVLNMHKTRSVRVLTARDGPKKISDAGLQDQAFRSRCVEICVTVTRNRNNLATAYETVILYLESEYGSFLRRHGVTTKVDQRAMYKRLMKESVEKLSQLDTIVELADKIIEDIDKASFALNRSLSALEVATKREWAR